MLKSSTVATDLSTFVNDWRTDSQVTKLINNLKLKKTVLNLFFYQCNIATKQKHPCSTVDLKTKAEAQCSILKSKTDSFKDCITGLANNTVANTAHYYESCLWDYCKAVQTNQPFATAVCSSLDALSTECVENSIVLAWRSNERCRKFSLFLNNK